VRGIRQRTAVLVVALAASVTGLGVARGHSPDPIVGGALWAQSQVVEYTWRPGQVPPTSMQAAINAAAIDSNNTRGSKAAGFDNEPTGDSLIAYGEPVPCGVNGIACFNRGNAPVTFAMWFRRHGHVFDWGTLRWCQFYSSPPDGCYDAENVALDEFGHVQILGHHENYTSESDYLDAVVQTFSRTKPRIGWNAHAYGRCDQATLQRKYDVRYTSSLYSTCLDLATTTALTVNDTSVPYRSSITLTATVRVASRSEYERLSGNLISLRAVVLQRRLPGGTWANVATMPAGSAAGTYAFSVVVTTTYEWRAVLRNPTNEGINGSISPGVTVFVSACTSICPQSATGLR
jgi:hypothetical protein